jgi:hypothetical protein
MFGNFFATNRGISAFPMLCGCGSKRANSMEIHADPDPDTEHQCYGSALVSMRIWIQVATPMWIHGDPDPDPGQTVKSQKVEKQKQGLFVNFGQFPCSWIRSGIAFPIRIRTWIQDSQINADPCGSGIHNTAEHWKNMYINSLFLLIW